MHRIRLALCLIALCVPLAAAGGEFSPAQLQGFARDSLRIEDGPVHAEFKIWIADTPQRQEQGLMFLTELPPGYGMLFPVNPPRAMSMWMKNTYVSLDMLFVGSDGRVVHIAHDATPLSTDIIASGGTVSAVLEIRAGESRRLGLREGSRIRHALFP